VASLDQRPAERDGREGMPGIAEGGKQKAPRRLCQTISARSRIMRLRASGSNAIGVQISVPTPASS
jgi:hypothetical protein